MVSQEPEILSWLHRELFEQVPFNIAIIDRDHNIIEANRNFAEYFGNWHGRKCFEAYKGRFSPCEQCQTGKTLVDGMIRVTDEVGIDRHGRTAHYVVHIAPIRDDKGEIRYVIEMSTDVTETKRWQREYSILFERAPCYIAVVDSNFRIIRTNERFRETFGSSEGKLCYQVYKHRKTKCANCPAVKTFKDGGQYTSEQTGLTKDNTKAHYIITTAPLSRGEEKIAHVIEMAADITEVKKLQERLARSIAIRKGLIRNSLDGIITIDRNDNTVKLNPAAQKLIKVNKTKELTAGDLLSVLPSEFFDLKGGQTVCHLPETEIIDSEGETIPVRFTGTLLKERNKIIGQTAFIQDLSEIKKLEKEKLDAERLAAVGQTVAGLAHSVKNILMGLEGGMYMVRSGLKKGSQSRISEGWEILERNFEKTTSLVKDFLSFAKGRPPRVAMVHPNDLVKAIVDLY
ncbi:MAG: PAS domain S-box protein, partial [FCB group bacterium]|nr:PAS domain S-box protein [FCB group bacterium]